MAIEGGGEGGGVGSGDLEPAGELAEIQGDLEPAGGNSDAGPGEGIRLSGRRRILITGASAGIGAALGHGGSPPALCPNPRPLLMECRSPRLAISAATRR